MESIIQYHVDQLTMDEDLIQSRQDAMQVLMSLKAMRKDFEERDDPPEAGIYNIDQLIERAEKIALEYNEQATQEFFEDNPE